MFFRKNLILSCLLYLFFVHSCLQGTIYTVTSNLDTNASGTLRYALLNASSGDTINFGISSQTITIGSNGITTALPYLQGVAINGGSGNTVSGKGNNY